MALAGCGAGVHRGEHATQLPIDRSPVHHLRNEMSDDSARDHSAADVERNRDAHGEVSVVKLAGSVRVPDAAGYTAHNHSGQHIWPPPRSGPGAFDFSGMG